MIQTKTLAVVLVAIATVGTIGMTATAFAAAPPQGGDPHGFTFMGTQITPSTGDPHSAIAQHGDPHICITTVMGKPTPTQC